MVKEIKRIYRSENDSVIGGVCAGIGEYFEVDPVLIRIIAVILALLAFSGVIAYFILWIIIPKKPKIERKEKVSKKKK